MARVPQGRIILTMEELTWAATALERRINHIELAKSNRERALLIGLYNKLTDLIINPPQGPSDDFILETGKKELRTLQLIAQTLGTALLTQVVPAYLERARGKKDSTASKYAKTAQEKGNMLLKLANKAGRLR